jgi:exodeoxyribonuclease VII large subunit
MLQQSQTRLARTFTAQLQGFRDRVAQLNRALQYLSPAARLANARQRVDDVLARADTAVVHRLIVHRQQVQGLAARLTALNPDAVLARGYAIVQERETGHVITSAKAITPGLALTLRLQDGEAAARGE